MEETVNERLAILVDQLANGKQKLFAAHIGVAPSTISNIIGYRLTKPSFDVLFKIKDKYPSVNLEWVVTGNGEMFLSSQERKKNPELESELNEAKNQIRALTAALNFMTEKLGKTEVIDLTARLFNLSVGSMTSHALHMR